MDNSILLLACNGVRSFGEFMRKGINEKGEEYLEYLGVPCKKCGAPFSVRAYLHKITPASEKSIKEIKRITSVCNCNVGIFYNGGAFSKVDRAKQESR